MKIDLILKVFFINIFTYICTFRIMNKKANLIFVSVFSILNTIIHVILKSYISNIYLIIISYFIQSGLLTLIIKDNRNTIYTANIISNAIVYVVFTVSAVIETIIRKIFNIDSILLNLIFILMLESFILYGISRIKRLKNGVSFITSRESSEFLDIITINVCSIILFIYCLFGTGIEEVTKHIIAPLIILGIIMFIMIQKTLILYYKQKLLKKTLEEDKEEIAKRDKKIQELSDEKFKISKLNHEFYHRQKSLELAVQEFISNSKSEASDEIGIMHKIQSLSKEYSGKVEEIKTVDRLCTTNIPEIDDMFKYMQSECKNNNIDFNLQINGNIFYIINNLIDKSRLVTLIGDHIRDAIIAINHSNNKNRSIIAILGMKDKYYEFSVYDTGIEFEIDTLLKLGLEPATTHKNEGGTGIGFITTFETLKETKASLVIEEKHGVVDNDYTKSVTITFDGKNEYRIISYRSDEIKKKNKNGRIIIK